jgi:formylmethanofuran dehydrogenase subunit B
VSSLHYELENVPCPFCGLACDDLRIGIDEGSLEVRANGCPISVSAFARAGQGAGAQTRVMGAPVPLAEAVDHAGRILRDARQPLISGLATDVAGARSALALSDRIGAVIDHMGAAAKLRNLLVLQDAGWITTTLTETRNRADLLILVGTDVVSRFPRFFERFVWVPETLFGLDPGAREIVYLGEARNTEAGIAPDGRKPTIVACGNSSLGEVLGALRTLAAGRRVPRDEIAGIPLAILASLAQRMQRAAYGVAAWAAGDLAFPHAELTVQTLTDLIRDLNRTTRFNGLALAGSDGDFTLNQVHTWQTGFPFRTSLATGHPVYDPYHFGTERLLASGEADALLWVSSLNPSRLPPATGIPTIVLGSGSMALEREPDVFIPVATSGVDTTGHFFRADKVVALPLRKLRESPLPSAAAVLDAILNALG